MTDGIHQFSVLSVVVVLAHDWLEHNNIPEISNWHSWFSEFDCNMKYPKIITV